MADTHYDVIVLGESLASRIAAVLLTNAGRRVLSFTPAPESLAGGDWIPAGRHLEHLLGLLGERSGLTSAPPFQLLSGDIRLTFHGNTSLPEELRREFAGDGERVAMLLREFIAIAERLEDALRASGGLPLTGWASRWRYTRERLRRGLTSNKLSRPLTERLHSSFPAPTAQALAALFSGLSLTPVEELSVAEGALLWRGHADSRGISAVALSELLARRFEQFHGESARLNDLKNVRIADGRRHEVVFHGGRRCMADTVLLGSPDGNAVLSPDNAPSVIRSVCRTPLIVSVPSDKVSPLLCPVVIADGSPPLRLTLATASGDDRCRIVCRTAGSTGTTPTSVAERLAALFPFAPLQLDSGSVDELEIAAPGRRVKPFPGAARALLAGKNLLICCGSQVLPTLGTTGEVLVGFSTAGHLQRQKGS